MLSVDELVHTLVDVVSKNGNLLLDVGPADDGSISKLQLERLHGLGDWLAVNGEAIFGTRPWIRAEGHSSDGIAVRFTSKPDALYAVLLGRPQSPRVVISSLKLAPTAHIELLGIDDELTWEQEGPDVRIVLPHESAGAHAWVFKITPKPEH
jgi:alpha-L-fucosidase